jgi:hypothetical protein
VIITFNNINQFIFIMVRCNVSFEVKTGYLNIVKAVHVGFVVDTVALGQAFLQVFRFSPVNIIHIDTPYSYVSPGMNNRPIGGDSSETCLITSISTSRASASKR